jgi:type VI secretion system protein ImpH
VIEEVQPLDQNLVEHPYRFDFFQAVRLLGLILPDRPDVGSTAKPSEELVRFKARQSLEFPASAIHDLDIEHDPARMMVAFLGLTGFEGVLPHHYTEHILARAGFRDFAMAEFLDLFNHRLISLFYRAWEKHHVPALYQKAAVRKDLPDGFTQYLFDLIGMGTDGLRGRMSVRDEALLRYAGLFAQYPRCASALQGILHDHFGVPVEVEEFDGAWRMLDFEELCILDDRDIRNELGVGAIAGDGTWDPQARFRIRIGPVPLARFVSFLPGGPAVRELEDITRLYVGEVLLFDWQVVLEADEVPACELNEEALCGPRLGWCAWLKTNEFEADAEDAVFTRED